MLPKSGKGYLTEQNTCKYHELVFVTEIIFCNNLKIQWKNTIWFCVREIWATLTSRLPHKIRPSLQHSIAPNAIPHW